MKYASWLGLAIAAFLTFPAVALESGSSAKPVVLRHHHHYGHHNLYAAHNAGVSPKAKAEAPPIETGANDGSGKPSAEWDCNGGDAGCTWEPYGWRRN